MPVALFAPPSVSPLCLCRPVFPLSLSALLFVFLSTFACPPLPFHLWCSPFSLGSVGTPCLCPPASPFHRCRPPFSTRSVRLSFSPASSPPTFPSASVRLSFPYLSLSASPFHLCRPPFSMCSGSLPFRRFLSACFFLRLSPSVFLPRFRPPFFPSGLCLHTFFHLCLSAFSFPCHPPFSMVCPSAFLRLPFPFAPVCPIFLSTPAPAYFSPPSLHPSFPCPCPPARQERGEAP
ncbi:hypothetical protein SAMN05444424_0330 [Bittarella massiliensis (ex Durand et al. 2017)]|uniref:Uncharacterized protein n=1 Tax=Bittarella massiliensis (ex Durand et al. 2017) TaxID=1720313 RepID=A0AAQ1RUZ5_9FIRM|nr:hypothetical protein SAMN05444424_0330 [Bittarella massiliensis (ex Durand et al. 2017)]